MTRRTLPVYSLSVLSLLVTTTLFATIAYPPPTILTGGLGPSSVAVGDFNQDCATDFATADQFANSVTVRFGDGSGGFAASSTVAGLVTPVVLGSADFNEDGAQDLAVGNNAGFSADPVGHIVSILLNTNDGSGHFATLPVASSPATNGFVTRLVAADVNEDGHADLLAIDANSSPYGVRLYAGDGTGHFAAPTVISTDTHSPNALVAAKLNGDNHLDLAVTTGDTTAIFLGNGDGTFGAPSYLLYPDPIEGADGAAHVAAADIDHDGDVDLVTTAGNFPGGVTVFRNNGDATFTRSRFKINSVVTNPIFVALADLDGDGNIDIVTANQYGCTPDGSNLSARPGNGDGTFGAIVPISVGYGPTCLNSHWQPNAIAAVDLNCDSAADLIVPNMNTAYTSVLLTPGAADTTAPVVTAPPAVSVSADASCTALVTDAQLGAATASDNCSDCVSIVRTGVPTGNVFPSGTTALTYTASDGHGNTASATQDVTVTASSLTISGGTATPSTLWPPNHKWVPVTMSYSASGCGSNSCTITSITSNEPVNGLGDGDASPDWQLVDDHHVKLRAERSGTGAGRVYTLTITCSDGGGHTATKTVTVTVPLSQK